jgi:hypothetical protein
MKVLIKKIEILSAFLKIYFILTKIETNPLKYHRGTNFSEKNVEKETHLC